MRYVVRGRPIVAKMASFWAILNDGTVEAQEPDGSEIVASMKRAVVNSGRVEWHETCYCSPLSIMKGPQFTIDSSKTSR